MPKIILQTTLHSTAEICFDLSRSIDLHKISTVKNKEEAIAGKITGLISLGESVTWKATHFGIRQVLTSKITRFERPFYFRDEQVNGAFKAFKHDHYFDVSNHIVVMKDIFEFTTPFGIPGKLFNKLVLTRYMTKLLTERNAVIKVYAETGKWKLVLHGNPGA